MFYSQVKKEDKRKTLSDDELIRLCRIGYTDAAIGEMYNMTGEGVAYRRKRLGISLLDKKNKTRDAIEQFKKIPREILEADYYSLTQEKFSEKYRISKIIWRPYLKNLGIISKVKHRIESYPSFSKEQQIMIIGSLLGDGSVSGKDFYYEFHSYDQEQYLRRKYNILKPYSSNIMKNRDGLKFSTIHHPNFKKYYDLFYKEGIDGKLIPVEYIKNNWHDHILAYWFFDDGYYDDETNEISIANKCPFPNQFVEFKNFLESVYHWNFHCYMGNIYKLSFSKEYYGNFVDILLQIITPDLLIKIPEKFLTNNEVKAIDVNSSDIINPKFYRKLTIKEKTIVEKKFFDLLKNRPFPFKCLTEERKVYLLNIFKSNKVKIKNNIIKGSESGLGLCELFFPNIYECKRKGYRSPIELWGDSKFIQRLAINRLKYANRLTDSSLRTGIKLLSKAVSNFKPVIAKFLYKQYAPNGCVLDYSCGFGSRMLAAMSLNMEYIGCEPNLKTYENLQKFGKFLQDNTKGSFQIFPTGSEETKFTRDYFDFAFSSPPFFDHEIYSQDSGQSIIKFPIYNDWLVGYWRKTIENCRNSLISGGYFGVCISLNHEDLIKRTRLFCQELKLKFVMEYRSPYKQLFQNNKDKYDLILIFQKI